MWRGVGTGPKSLQVRLDGDLVREECLGPCLGESKPLKKLSCFVRVVMNSCLGLTPAVLRPSSVDRTRVGHKASGELCCWLVWDGKQDVLSSQPGSNPRGRR